jgi:hypothetical protein
MLENLSKLYHKEEEEQQEICPIVDRQPHFNAEMSKRL